MICQSYTQEQLYEEINVKFQDQYNYFSLPQLSVTDYFDESTKNKGSNKGYFFINFIDPNTIISFSKEIKNKKLFYINSGVKMRVYDSKHRSQQIPASLTYASTQFVPPKRKHKEKSEAKILLEEELKVLLKDTSKTPAKATATLSASTQSKTAKQSESPKTLSTESTSDCKAELPKASKTKRSGFGAIKAETIDKDEEKIKKHHSKLLKHSHIDGAGADGLPLSGEVDVPLSTKRKVIKENISDSDSSSDSESRHAHNDSKDSLKDTSKKRGSRGARSDNNDDAPSHVAATADFKGSTPNPDHSPKESNPGPSTLVGIHPDPKSSTRVGFNTKKKLLSNPDPTLKDSRPDPDTPDPDPDHPQGSSPGPRGPPLTTRVGFNNKSPFPIPSRKDLFPVTPYPEARKEKKSTTSKETKSKGSTLTDPNIDTPKINQSQKGIIKFGVKKEIGVSSHIHIKESDDDVCEVTKKEVKEKKLSKGLPSSTSTEYSNSWGIQLPLRSTNTRDSFPSKDSKEPSLSPSSSSPPPPSLPTSTSIPSSSSNKKPSVDYPPPKNNTVLPINEGHEELNDKNEKKGRKRKNQDSLKTAVNSKKKNLVDEEWVKGWKDVKNALDNHLSIDYDKLTQESVNKIKNESPDFDSENARHQNGDNGVAGDSNGKKRKGDLEGGGGVLEYTVYILYHSTFVCSYSEIF